MWLDVLIMTSMVGTVHSYRRCHTHLGTLHSQSAIMGGATQGLNYYFFPYCPRFFFFLTERIKLNSHILDVNWEHGTTTVVIY